MKAKAVQEALRNLGTLPSKALGQHFLLREDLAEAIVEYAEIEPGERVLEVGPGLGVLTERLLRRTPRVVAVELDTRLAEALRTRLPQLELIQGDVLRVPLPPFEKVVSNLPFEISSAFVDRLLPLPFRRAVLTFQKEFAERLVADAGSKAYSRLSVKVYYRSRARIRRTVPPSAFWPSPEVAAAVVQLDARPPPFDADPGRFYGVVDALFLHRRKTAANALRLSRQWLGLSSEDLEAGLRDSPFATRRPEQLRPEDMAELAKQLYASKD